MPSAAPASVLEELLGSPLSGLGVWAGKDPKTDRRLFAHAQTPDGRLWFAKISTSGGGALRAEFDALREVQALLAETPYAAACAHQTRYSQGVMVQEWRSGISLHQSLVSRRRRFWKRGSVQKDCFAVTDWLAGFHSTGSQASERSLGDRGPTHGDFKPANILLRGDIPLAVVDWELFERHGIQIHDLFQFLMYVGMTLEAPDRQKGIRSTFFERSWISEIARGCVGRYLAKIKCAHGSLTLELRQYLETMLDRRATLGLSNDGYFLNDARTLAAEWRGAPYAFEPLEPAQGAVR